ncbi:ELWxxDGT repeat protein [Aquimarina sp. 2201CG14-23]|uniref:ELWxxDGT repeat protein n=1 Tax=Aquimarina mycalae TaxID=3040073 RepID=UPI002477E4AD|nr:ELWxxDGT repeat protein [Aquimarina sp. 2201CG14-23]MDH7447415.1 MBG domain-containing protein [Aquimarina sp. 2201CG14-23]
MRSIFTLLFFTLCIQINAQQAYLVKDINTGSSFGANVDNLVEFQGYLFFSAEDDPHGDELWVSDGTPEGTHLFVDIESGAPGSSPTELTIFEDKLYFRARDAVYGQELWVTDGTPLGTKRIIDLNPGPNSGRIANITVFNNKLYFTADDGVHGTELWESDGTETGTKMVKDIYVGNQFNSSYPRYLTVYNGKLYFSANDSSENGTELWVTDGTETGTQLVKNINPNIYGSGYPLDITVFNNKLYFRAFDGIQTELWESDGTEAGTKLAVDIFPGGDSYPFGFIVFNSKLYFTANNGSSGRELFESDGTSSGTKLVADINPGNSGSNPEDYIIFQNKLFFNAYNPSTGVELWESDGTETGTQLVKDIYSGTNDGNPQNFLVFNNQLFFSAKDAFGGSQLWVSDGTETGTNQLLKIGESSTASNARYFIDYNNEVYFRARDGIHGTELWKSDGTEDGTVMVMDNNPGSGSGADNMLGVINGKLYYEGDDGIHGNELWETDGTAAGTKLVKDINPGNGDSYTDKAVVLNNKLYFRAEDPAYGSELWVSDGTAAGTQRFTDINPGTGHSFITELVVFNNKLYFGANDGVHGTELWESDGTEAGTRLLNDIVTGTYGSSPRYFKVYNNKLYFNAWDAIHGEELWETDGSTAGTKLVKDMYPGSLGSSPQWMAVYQNKLYFKANDGIHGSELWESDGTEVGTKLAVDIREGNNGSSVRELVAFQNRLYFRASDGVFGSELWTSNGTPEGTYLVADMRPGSGGSSLDDMVISNGKLFFNADDGIYQEEVWAFEPFDCSTLTSTVLYVSSTGTETNNGGSWTEATSLQHALKLAQQCPNIQEIWVQQGTYKPGKNRFNTFSIPSNVKIYGGFDGTETNIAQRDWVANITILNGDIGIPEQISGNTLTLLSLQNTNNVHIDGFIIEEANAEFDNFIDNLADTRGGGIYLKNANNSSIVNCIFRNNFGQEGAAVYHTSGNNTKFINCLFYENEAQQTSPIFVEADTANLINTTLVNNTAVSGNGILGTKDATITLTNSILEGTHTLNFNTTGTGSLTANYSYLKGENPTGTGNIDGTSITDVSFKDVANKEYTLLRNSPLVDKGNNSTNTETKGLGGNERIIDGDLDMTNTIDIGAYEYSRLSQTITFNSLADVIYGDTNLDLTATSDSGLVVTYVSSDTNVATISGNTVTLIGAGTTTITASQAGNTEYLPALDVSQTITVNPRPITVTADAGQSKVFGAIDPVFTYAITNGNLVANDVLTGSLTRTAGEDVGTYPINQGTLGNPNYDIDFVTNDFEIIKADQIITFNPLTDVIYGDPDFNLNATTDSGLTVNYSTSDTSVATISGNTVTIVGVGSTTITASQIGNTNYNTAPDVTQTLTVTPKAITITADSGQSKLIGTSDPILTYSITNGYLIAGDTFIGNLERATGEDAGTYPINQGTLNHPYYNITFASNSFEIIKATQTITFNPLTNVTYGDSDFNLGASTTSGLEISYSSSNTNVINISGNTVTIVGAGSTTITARQEGNGNYNAAVTVSQTLTVLQKAITIAAETGQTKVFGAIDPIFTYAITTGNLVASDVLTGNLGRVSGEDVGFYSINQGTLSNSNYDITFVINEFEITKATQSITFDQLTNVHFGDPAFDLNAIASSGLAITYSTSDNNIVNISGNKASIMGEGFVVISAYQPGNENYLPANSVARVLTVLPGQIDEALIKLYPNPVVDEIQISEIPSNNRLSIYNSNGRLVKQIIDYSKEETIPVVNLPSGIYLVEIVLFDYRAKTIIKRFIKN